MVINEMTRARPAPGLRGLIAFYSGYRQRGVAPAVHRGLPSPFLTVIFTLHEPLQLVAHVDPKQRPGRYGTMVGGLHTSPALIAHDGAQSGVQVHVSPLGARSLLGLPAGELAGCDFDGTDVLGPTAVEIQQRLQFGRDWPERFAVLDDVFGRHVSESELAPELRYAWSALVRTGGQVSITELCDEVGWSARHLQNRFRREIGLTPKAAARVVRFDRARRFAQRQRSSLTDIAAGCGYFDQAHLTREFHALAGCTPSHWLASEFANVQAQPQLDHAD